MSGGCASEEGTCIVSRKSTAGSDFFNLQPAISRAWPPGTYSLCRHPVPLFPALLRALPAPHAPRFPAWPLQQGRVTHLHKGSPPCNQPSYWVLGDDDCTDGAGLLNFWFVGVSRALALTQSPQHSPCRRQGMKSLV